MRGKDKDLGRSQFFKSAVGKGAIISAPVRWPIQFWTVVVILLVIVIAALLTASSTSTVTAAPESNPPLDCLSCHTKILKGHDKLGTGNEACWVCHDSTHMGMLRLFDGTLLSLEDSPQVCGQCHQERYNAWKEGTHGFPGVVATGKCTSCHKPHQPQIALLDITKPHPEVQLVPSPPPFTLLAVVGTSVLLAIILGIIVMRKGEWPWAG